MRYYGATMTKAFSLIANYLRFVFQSVLGFMKFSFFFLGFLFILAVIVIIINWIGGGVQFNRIN